MADTAQISRNKKTIASDSGVFEKLLTERSWLLAALIGLMLIVMWVLGNFGVLQAQIDLSFLLRSLISMVPLALLALAEMFVILSGRSGIDLSVGGMVSLVGMLFGFMVGPWEIPIGVAIICAILAGGVLGALNGFMVGYLGFPPLIATLATSYLFGSIALLSNGQRPISGERITELNSMTQGIGIPGFLIPAHVLTMLLPVFLVTWYLLERSTWGRRILAVGTNNTAARYATISVKPVRASAYVISGLLCGIAAVVNVAQFASARPDAGVAGAGMTLPAITIAVLGGVAIMGGRGKVGSTVLAALLVTWLNANLLVSFTGSAGSRVQLLALGVLLVASVFLNNWVARVSQRRAAERAQKIASQQLSTIASG